MLKFHPPQKNFQVFQLHLSKVSYKISLQKLFRFPFNEISRKLDTTIPNSTIFLRIFRERADTHSDRYNRINV